MKTHLLRLAMKALIPAAASAATLVDGSTRNGGFETGTGAYTTGANWFNYGASAESTSLYSAASPIAGTKSGIVSLASQPALNTGWVIALGDAYSLGFDFRNSNTTSGTLRWHLYYYANEGQGGFVENTDTSRVDLTTGDHTLLTNSTTVTAASGSLISVADINAVGKTLYLGFERTAAGSFPVIDNVVLSATAIPEPSAYGLLGAGALAGLVVVRRRRRN